VASIPGEEGLAGGGGWVLEQEDIELYLLVDRIGVGDGRKGELRGKLGGGGDQGVRGGARPIQPGRRSAGLGERAKEVRGEARKVEAHWIEARRRGVVGATPAVALSLTQLRPSLRRKRKRRGKRRRHREEISTSS